MAKPSSVRNDNVKHSSARLNTIQKIPHYEHPKDPVSKVVEVLREFLSTKHPTFAYVVSDY